MKRRNLFATYLVAAATVVAAAFLAMPGDALAASCCGGGSASTLVLPKLGQSEYSVSVSREHYTGYWNKKGTWQGNPLSSDLNQYRLALGAAMRLAPRWQASVSVPYVWNENHYSNRDSSTKGVGDTTVGIKYETFEHVMCLTNIESWQDLLPAVYLGAALTIPTGVSPYDDVKDSFDVTGRGFYRAEANMLIEKTIFPWNLSIDMSYGTALERDVNRENGNYVKEPYRKKLGDRFAASARFGAGIDLPWGGATLTPAVSYSYVREGRSERNGQDEDVSGFSTRGYGLSVSLANFTNEWIGTVSWNHSVKKDDWGRNFPTTDTWMLGVSHVLYE